MKYDVSARVASGALALGFCLACNPQSGSLDPLRAPPQNQPLPNNNSGINPNPRPFPTSPVTATDGQALVFDEDTSVHYVADAEDGVVSRISRGQESVREFPISGEPTRLVEVNGRLAVTLRAERQVAVLVDDNGTLREIRRVDVGAEPFGLVAAPDDSAIFVASSMSNRVDEISTETWSITRSWDVPDQPTWLAMHPSGQRLYVTTARNGRLFDLNVATGVLDRVDLPTIAGFPDFNTGRLLGLTPRMTGDPAASPLGTQLAIPMLFVDNISEIPEEGPGDPGPLPGPPGGGGYSDKMNPAVVLIDTGSEGALDLDEIEIVRTRAEDVSSYPASVTFSPDGKMLAATLEGARAVVLMDLVNDWFPTGGEFEPGIREQGLRSLLLVETGEGPRSVAFTSDNEAWVYSFIDRQIDRVDLTDIRDLLENAGPIFGEFGYFETAQDSIQVSTNRFSDAVERGRRLFFSSTDSRMALPEGGVSCATCHSFDARDDGLTWSFERGPRQTPSLAGLVSLRAPVGWAGQAATVADDAMGTSQGLMGGVGLSMDDALDIEAYIDHTRDVDIPTPEENDPTVELGREIFNRADVGCAGCHSGALYTDLQQYNVNGFDGVKTPSLLGLWATAPYLHDGSADTIRDLLARLQDGTKGSTAGLTEVEMDALATYLLSL